MIKPSCNPVSELYTTSYLPFKIYSPLNHVLFLPADRYCSLKPVLLKLLCQVLIFKGRSTAVFLTNFSGYMNWCALLICLQPTAFSWKKCSLSAVFNSALEVCCDNQSDLCTQNKSDHMKEEIVLSFSYLLGHTVRK